MKIQLDDREALSNTPDELARVLLARFGLLPRKKDASANLHSLLLELNEKKKRSVREKNAGFAIMSVDEMALYAGIARQTMYDYLSRWTGLHILKKSSVVDHGKVVMGYELNGNSLESAFRKAETTISNLLDGSFKVLLQLQSEIKREKLRKTKKQSNSSKESFLKET